MESKEKKPDNPWYYYLNSRLIKRRKPCLTGDLVHLQSFSGLYKVHATSISSFTVMKNHKEVQFPWEQFRCLQGQGTSEETIIKRELKALIYTIHSSMIHQSEINECLKDELKNLRKTF